MASDLTRHARIRMQQRCIGAAALDLLCEFGREAFDHRGHAVVLYFDKKARRRLERAAPGMQDLGRTANCYAVVSAGGQVLTVGHRYRRICHD